jgi:DNA-binding NarL/FixJ family response regulator
MIRVLLVDDDPLVRSGLRKLLGGAPEIKVVAEAEDGDEVLAAVDRQRSDVVLMLTTFDADDFVFRALRAGGGETGTPRHQADRLLAGLSPRELEVARAVGRGLANADISAELHPSVATVKAHVSKVMEKLGVDNRVQLALLIRDASLPGAAPLSSSRAG